MQQLHQEKIISHHKYMRKITYYSQDPYSQAINYEYVSLNGIARPDISFIELFLVYFNSPYDKHYESPKEGDHPRERIQRKKKHLSVIYRAYIQMVVLRTTFTSHESERNHLDSLVQEFDYPTNQDKELIEVTRDEIQSFYQHQLLRDKRSNDKVCRNLESFCEFQSRIDKVVADLRKQLKSQTSYGGARINHETLPQYVSQNDLRTHVLKMFDKLKSLPLLTRMQKQRQLGQLPTYYKHYLNLQLTSKKGLISHIGLLLDKNSILAITTSNNPEQKQHQLLTLRQFLFPSKNLLNLRCQISFQVRLEIVQNVLRLIDNFSSMTKSYYPSLSLSDILINGQTYQVQLDWHKLILEWMGVTQNTESVEVALAYNCKYDHTEDEASWMQQQKEYQWLLKKRAYFPQTLSEQASPQDRQNLEKMHTWRVMAVVFAILHQKHWIKWEAKQRSVDIKTTFLTNQLKKTIDHQLRTGTKSLNALFEMHQEGIDNPQKVSGSCEPFHFTLTEIKQLFLHSHQQDSYLLDMSPHSIFLELQTRQRLSEHISCLLSHQSYFRKFLNARKYMILAASACLEEAYQIVRWLWVNQDSMSDQERTHKVVQLWKIGRSKNESQSVRRSRLAIAFSKIHEYQQRESNDLQNKALNQSKDQMYIFTSMEKGYKEMIKLVPQFTSYAVLLQNTRGKNQAEVLQVLRGQSEGIEAQAKIVINNSLQLLESLVDKSIKVFANFYESIQESALIEQNPPNGSFKAYLLYRSLLLSVELQCRLNTLNHKSLRVVVEQVIRSASFEAVRQDQGQVSQKSMEQQELKSEDLQLRLRLQYKILRYEQLKALRVKESRLKKWEWQHCERKYHVSPS